MPLAPMSMSLSTKNNRLSNMSKFKYLFPAALLLWLSSLVSDCAAAVTRIGPDGGGGGTNYGPAWAVILLCTFLGLIVTLKSSRRTSEVKKQRTYEE